MLHTLQRSHGLWYGQIYYSPENRKNKMRHYLSRLLLLTLLGSASIFAQNPEPSMTFSDHDPCGGGNSYDCRPFIFAQGPISQKTAEDFRRFVASRPDKRQATVYFDSNGGSLGGGLELGRAIRELGYDTYVGKEYRAVSMAPKKGSLGWSEQLVSRSPNCLSACVYAFIGGKSRKLDIAGKLGVHQFRSSMGDIGETNAQLVFSALSKYVREMGVSAELLEIASSAPPAGIRWITKQQATILRLHNANSTPTPWSVFPSPDGRPNLAVHQIIDPGRVLLVSITQAKNQRALLMRLTLSSDIAQEVREATIEAIKNGDFEVRLDADGQNIDWEVSKNWAPITSGMPQASSLSFVAAYALSPLAFQQLKKAEKLQIAGNTPGRVREAQFWISLSTTGIKSGIALLER